MGERILVAAAVILATACEIIDVSCRCLSDRFLDGFRQGGNKKCPHPPSFGRKIEIRRE